MTKAINKYRTARRVLITYEELKDIPLHEVIDIDLEKPGTITCTKISNNDFSQSLRVEMKQESYWSTHYHDCIETILVFTGTLYDHTGDKSIDRYNPAIINKYEDHLIEAVTDSVFYVEFLNPNLDPQK
tara:strand:- start:146 stop:532 length:387 start_codon:yes stop_codon:yes gene_type:complete